MVTEYDKKVETILAHRRVGLRGVPNYIEYLIKWWGLLKFETSWEKEDLSW